MMVSGFDMEHVVSIRDFTVDEIDQVLDYAEKLVPIAKGEEKTDKLNGKILATLFFEPSTRTMLSFETAMKRFGGNTIGFANPEISSVKKGETLADTIRVAAEYADIIVLRHPQEGAARLAAKFSTKPILNAGDGAGQHPTQTLLDLFTIKAEKEGISNNHIGIAGDLKYGRTVHSLTHALAMYDTELTFIAPSSLQMPDEIIKEVKEEGIDYHIEENLDNVIDDLDLLYMTRIQKERFPNDEEYHKVASSYNVSSKILQGVKEDFVIMHPLPRVDEITPDVDDTSYAKYFEQAGNGVPVRMALLDMLLEVE